MTERIGLDAFHDREVLVILDLSSWGQLGEMAEVVRNFPGPRVVIDHHVSQGLYVSDCDGNLIELYVDADERVWHDDPASVANSDPLRLP